jgi:hypothetical protein
VWPLGHVGHVTYSFINMLFISMGDFCLWFYDQLRPQIVSVGTTANAPVRRSYKKVFFKISILIVMTKIRMEMHTKILLDCLMNNWD